MSRIFLSHSSVDELEAVALKCWLADNGWDDVFLDVDAERGLVAGERWQEALKRAADRCEAVVFVVSPAWAQSKWCLAEFLLAKSLNKRIFGVVLKDVPIGDLPTEMTAEWQLCHLAGWGAMEAVACVHREQRVEVAFLAEGLARLKAGLRNAGLQAEYFPWPPKDDPRRAPFRGLEPLDAIDAAVFFGRDVEILQGLDKLRGMRSSGAESLFVILGASGAGKSSFLRAGLLPRLARDERHFFPLQPIRPERSPLHGERGMAAAIRDANEHLNLAPRTLGDVKLALGEGVERCRALLRNIQDAARTRLVGLPEDAPSPTLLLSVDQAEELFNADGRTNPGEAGEAHAFLELIGMMLRADPIDETDGGMRPPLPMIVAFTIRSDRYEPLQTAAELAGLKSVVFDALKPMPRAQFKEVITGPAQRATAAGHSLVVRPDLVARLLADCEQGADTLPLLGLTLARLYREYGSGGDLRLDEYERMGGIADVIRDEAEAVLSADPGRRETELKLLRDAFIPALVTIDPDSDQAMRRVAALSDLPPDSRPLLRALIDRHLLLSDLRAGDPVVEVAHESLFRQWPVLAEWLRDERADLKDVDRLEQAVSAWSNSGRKAAWLMEGERLDIAETLAAKPRYSRRLEGAREFLLASRQRETQKREDEARRREERVNAEKAARLAAEERQQVAERLAQAQARERATAEAAAVRLKRQARKLVAATVGVVIALIFATVGLYIADAQKKNAQAALRQANGLRLTTESLAMLEGLRPGGSERALLQLVAAQRTAPHAELDAALLTVLLTNDMTKIWTTDAAVEAVAFSPDGNRVVSGGEDGTLRLWDPETGRSIGAALMGHQNRVSSVAYTPDGSRIVSGSWDNTLRLWDARDGRVLGVPLEGHRDAVYATAVSPDGARIVSASGDKTLRLWDARTGQPLGEPLQGHQDLVFDVAFSPDGTRIASGSLDRTLRLWDARSGKALGAPGEADTSVATVVFSPDGAHVVASSDPRALQVWDAATLRLVGSLEGHEKVTAVAFSADGTRMVSASQDKSLQLWDAGGWRTVGKLLRGHQDRVTSVAFSPNQSYIVVSGSDDRTLRLWDASGVAAFGAPLGRHESQVSSAAFSPDGTRIVSGAWDHMLRLWDATSGQAIGNPLQGHRDAVLSVAFSPDGSRIVSGGVDSMVRLWDAHSAQSLGEPLQGHQDSVFSVAFSPDGARIVSASRDHTIRLWDANSRQPIGAPLQGHDGMVLSIAFSPDGKRIASGGVDNMLRLWDAGSGEPLGAPLQGHTGAVWSVVFSHDGSRIVSGSTDETLRLWDANNGRPIGQPLRGHTNGVRSVAFSPDDTRIVSDGLDGSLRLWDAHTGAPVGPPLEGHGGTSVAFSPDGNRIMATTGNALILWPAPRLWPELLCAKLTRNMSRKEWRDWVSPVIDYTCQCPALPIPSDDTAPGGEVEICSSAKS